MQLWWAWRLKTILFKTFFLVVYTHAKCPSKVKSFPCESVVLTHSQHPMHHVNLSFSTPSSLCPVPSAGCSLALPLPLNLCIHHLPPSAHSPSSFTSARPPDTPLHREMDGERWRDKLRQEDWVKEKNVICNGTKRQKDADEGGAQTQGSIKQERQILSFEQF